MKKWKKALSCALAFAMLIPILTTTAFGGVSAYVPYIYDYELRNRYWFITDSERNKFNSKIFVTGEPGSASASGYAAFDLNGDFVYKQGRNWTADNVEPKGNIKWVLYDGILIVTNDMTEAEIEAEATANTEVYMRDNLYVKGEPNYEYNYGLTYRRMYQDMSTFDILGTSVAPQVELTPFRNNPYIETVIFGENIDYWADGNVFINCDNLKNVIALDGGAPRIVYDGHLDYSIAVAGETSGIYPGEMYSDEPYVYIACGADRVAHHDIRDGIDIPNKGYVSVGMPTMTQKYNEETGWIETYTYPDAATIAAQYATAKSHVEAMDLPDWALAYLPVEMGGTGTARTVDDVFNFESATLKSNWSDGTGSTTETPVVEPETPAVSTDSDTVTYSAWAEEDILTAVRMNYLDDDPDVFGTQPAVTTLLGSDYTKAITRGQFAALAVRYYETLMSDITGEDYTIPVNSGDDVFADSTGDEAIAKAFNLGILGGYNSADTRSGVYVGPDDNITREQAATMLTRLMECLIDDFNSVGRTGWTVWYADDLPFVDEIADWAYDGVRAVYGVGAMTGTSGTTFSAKSNYTIEQSVVTLMRIDNNWARAGRG